MSRSKSINLAILAIAVMSIVVAPAIADPINVTANRSVQVGDLPHGAFWGPNSPSVTLGTFDDSVTQLLGSSDPERTTASQSSDVQPGAGLFTGKGSASVGFSVLETDEVFANSFFDVFFDITVGHSYSLSGALEVGTDGGRGTAFVRLDGPTSLFFDVLDFGSVPVNSAGTLAAGNYHLTAVAIMDAGDIIDQGSFMGGFSSFAFDLNLKVVTSPIPEPEIYAMTGLGLGLLGWVGRRRKLKAA